VFLMIGGEGTASPLWMLVGQWIKYAQYYGALCLMLEHRYYGLSHPTPYVLFTYLNIARVDSPLIHFLPRDVAMLVRSWES